jgi:L-fuconolactonase
LPIADLSFNALLEQYAQQSKLKSLRHVIQGEPDDDFILRPDFNRGIRAITQKSLAYDILIFERHLTQTIRFVDQHPNQIFVVDHIAKPKIGHRELSPWRENIIELSKRPNVSCKISGMVTEADFNHWSEDQLKPYFDVVIEAFGPSRLMFGSDWPVCLVGVEYHRWLEIIKEVIKPLSLHEQDWILGKTSQKIYQLK